MSKATKKKRMQIFQQDSFTCKFCGKSPVTTPGLFLEIDHIVPFSNGGSDDLTNLQTKCMDCNRGKGNDESLNRTIKNDLDILLNKINPKILQELNIHNSVRVVANQEDYVTICEKNTFGHFYQIELIPNVLMGFGAGKNLGIYTINDYGTAKANFFLSGNLTG